MSEFLAEARVIIRPDTTSFRAQLQEEVSRAVSQTRVPPIQVPIAVTSAGLAAATAATTSLSAAQVQAQGAALGLANTERVLNSEFGRQATLLPAVALETQTLGAAHTQAAVAARSHAVAESQVGKAAIANTAGLLGLRGAVLTAGGAFIAATAGIQAFFQSVGLAANLERELNVFAVTAGATADEMERVSETARELGRDITLPGVAAQDAASTMATLARAGLDVQQAMDAARGTLQLATAAQIDNAQAAELVANALNAFGLSGDQAVRVADLLAGAANESQGSIQDMGLALRQAAAAANLVGLSVDDTVVLLTELARAGLSSSDAGTSLRTTLLRLVGDFPKVSAEVERLGLELRDVNGNVRPEFFAELGEKLRRMSPAARQATASLLGGADAVRAISILSRRTTEDLAATETAITRAGIASDLAAAQTEGLGGDVEATKNELADLGTTIGQVSSGPISLFVRTVGGAAGAINEFNQQLRETDQGLGRTIGDFFNRFSQSFARLNLNFQQGVRLAQSTNDNFSALARTTDTVTTSVNALADALERAAANTAAGQGLPQDEGLGVEQILNRVAGLDAEEVRARISGSTSTLLSVLQQEQTFLQSQLERQFVKNRPALRRQLEQALLGTVNDIESISRSSAAETKRAAEDLKREQQEADQALLSTLSDRRDDASRKAAAAAQTEGLADDIRAQNRIQALIKQQITKIRELVRDETARKEAIRQLRIALIASRREEEALLQERAQAQAARQQESIELDIALAETTQNTNREIAARQRLIALLKKQQAAVKRGTVEWKRLRNEIAEQQRAIREARDQAAENQDTGRTAQQFFFEQLQAQQGFAANLMGNLITGSTEGLVGVPAPSTPQRTVRASQAERAGIEGLGPTAGQTNTEISILERILHELKRLNGSYDAPEAIHQKKVGSGSMDNHPM